MKMWKSCKHHTGRTHYYFVLLSLTHILSSLCSRSLVCCRQLADFDCKHVCACLRLRLCAAAVFYHAGLLRRSCGALELWLLALRGCVGACQLVGRCMSFCCFGCWRCVVCLGAMVQWCHAHPGWSTPKSPVTLSNSVLTGVHGGAVGW